MKRLLALVAAFALASPAEAYWDYGHRTIASIAMANVTPRTRARVRRILATPRCSAPPNARRARPRTRRCGRTASSLAERAITSGASLIRRYPRGEKAALQAGTVTDWARESWRVAQDTVYAGALGGNPCAPTPAHVAISEAMIEAWVPPARLEVERGGLRLAKELDEALD